MPTIIIKRRKNKYEFYFRLTAKNLTPRIAANHKSIEFYETVSEDGGAAGIAGKTGKRRVFRIPGPVMSDAAGNRSAAVHYLFDHEEGESYILKVAADSEWINAAERVFPVRIDPSVEYVIATGGTSGSTAIAILYSPQYKMINKNIICTMPDLPAGAKIQSAFLFMNVCRFGEIGWRAVAEGESPESGSDKFRINMTNAVNQAIKNKKSTITVSLSPVDLSGYNGGGTGGGTGSDTGSDCTDDCCDDPACDDDVGDDWGDPVEMGLLCGDCLKPWDECICHRSPCGSTAASRAAALAAPGQSTINIPSNMVISSFMGITSSCHEDDGHVCGGEDDYDDTDCSGDDENCPPHGGYDHDEGTNQCTDGDDGARKPSSISFLNPVFRVAYEAPADPFKLKNFCIDCEPEMDINSTQVCKIVPVPEDAYNVCNTDFIWTSDDPEILQITSEGVITSGTTQGWGIIQATHKYTKLSTIAAIKVVDYSDGSGG